MICFLPGLEQHCPQSHSVSLSVFFHRGRRDPGTKRSVCPGRRAAQAHAATLTHDGATGTAGATGQMHCLCPLPSAGTQNISYIRGGPEWGPLWGPCLLHTILATLLGHRILPLCSGFLGTESPSQLRFEAGLLCSIEARGGCGANCWGRRGSLAMLGVLGRGANCPHPGPLPY